MIETVKVWYYREADTNPIIQTGAYADITLDADFAVILIRGHDHGIEDFEIAEECNKYFKALYLLETYLNALEALQGHKYTFGSIRAIEAGFRVR